MPATRKPDRRTQQTRSALRAAFVELVLSRGYAAVTVEDIIARAKVARSTFYVHFNGKLALLRHSLDMPCAGLAACVDEEDVLARLVGLLRHFLEHWHVNKVFLDDPIRSIWVRRLAGSISQKLRADPPRGARALPRSLTALTIAEMQIALIAHWLKDAASVSPERIAAAILASTRALVPAARSRKIRAMPAP